MAESKQNEENASRSCCICFQDLLPTGGHVVTNCGHLYCIRCLIFITLIDPYNSVCGYCRQELMDINGLPGKFYKYLHLLSYTGTGCGTLLHRLQHQHPRQINPQIMNTPATAGPKYQYCISVRISA